jgi:Trypsin-like peptidase domain
MAMRVDSISEQLFFCTLRIDTVDSANQQGSGTGFVLAYAGSDGLSYQFLTTNRHVIDGTVSGVLHFTRDVDGQPALGDTFRLKVDAGTWKAFWTTHVDPSIDIAVLPLQPILELLESEYKFKAFTRPIPSSAIPRPEQISEFDALEEITFVGYPNGIWDSKNLLPVARTGITATPISVDFEGSPKFLIDASVFGGSSGSPVFLFNRGTWTSRLGTSYITGRFFLLGIVTAVYYRTSANEIVSMPAPATQRSVAIQKEMIDVGIVLKARLIVEVIEVAISRFKPA